MPEIQIRVENLTIAYGEFVLQSNLSFDVRRGDIFVIMGPSGCGKSTLMKAMIGLKRPAAGRVIYEGRDFWALAEAERSQVAREFGVLYQTGALWSSMTLAENIALPLREYADVSAEEVQEIARFKLALVGLKGFEDFLPAEISGGMRKRAALARAMALDPEVLFLDEPSAGLDPTTSRRMDDLIMSLRESLGITFVMVSHELPSIFTVATNSVYLDAEHKTMLAYGNPHELLEHSDSRKVLSFLTRGEYERRTPQA